MLYSRTVIPFYYYSGLARIRLPALAPHHPPTPHFPTLILIYVYPISTPLLPYPSIPLYFLTMPPLCTPYSTTTPYITSTLFLHYSLTDPPPFPHYFLPISQLFPTYSFTISQLFPQQFSQHFLSLFSVFLRGFPPTNTPLFFRCSSSPTDFYTTLSFPPP